MNDRGDEIFLSQAEIDEDIRVGCTLNGITERRGLEDITRRDSQGREEEAEENYDDDDYQVEGAAENSSDAAGGAGHQRGLPHVGVALLVDDQLISLRGLICAQANTVEYHLEGQGGHESGLQGEHTLMLGYEIRSV